MTVEEFSNEFDVLYNNVMSNSAPGLNEYEKSVFLTKALDEIVKSYFNLESNKLGKGFDDTERRLVDFSMLMKTELVSEISGSIQPVHSANNVKHYKLPADILLFINEAVTVSRGNLTVVPINYLEYSRNMSKPFKRPLKNQAWRLMISTEGSQSVAELIPGPSDTITKYVIRYIARPKAIVLTNFTDEGVSIGGATTKLECKLDPILHHEILLRAVELAKAAYTGDLQSQVALGVNSETPMGIISRK